MYNGIVVQMCYLINKSQNASIKPILILFMHEKDLLQNYKKLIFYFFVFRLTFYMFNRMTDYSSK